MVGYPRTCKVCGKTFLAKRADAEVCNNNSTCRVKLSRQNKKASIKAQLEAERMTIPLEQYALYEAVCVASPMMGNSLSQMLKLHGSDAFALMLNSLVYVFRLEVQQ